MKKLLLSISQFGILTGFLFTASLFAQDANVSIQTLNSYYDTYNNTTKRVTGIYLAVGADGTNSSLFITTEFECMLYLLPCDVNGTISSTTPITAKIYNVLTNTLKHYGSYTFSNQSVDLSTVSGLADGMYRIGGWVNSNSAISNPPDNPSDNAGLMQSSVGGASGSVINYTAPASTSVQMDATSGTHFINFPNPALTQTTFSYALTQQPAVSSIKVYNLMGTVVNEINLNTAQGRVDMDLSTLSNGIYYCSLIADGKVISTNRMAVSH